MAQLQGYRSASPVAADRVELMVHGVGGTTPEEMLESAEISQVRGDGTAGFFRLRHQDSSADIVREAYSWGGLTAGSASRAFWVFLAPFAFLNVAGWMLPATSSETRLHSKITTGLLRLIGFTVTVHSIIWIGQMSIDFAAWQCGGQVACRSNTWIISLFGMSWFEGAPGRRLAVGAIVPLLAIYVVYRLVRRTVDRYETVSDGAVDDYNTEIVNSFGDPTFWRRGTSISSFASLHLAGSGAALALVLAWTFAWLQPAGTPWAQITIAVFALALLLVSTISIAVLRSENPATDRNLSTNLAAGVLWHRRATIAVIAACLLVGVVWPGYQDPARSIALDPYSDVWRWVWVVSIVSLVGFAIAVVAHPNRNSRVVAPLAADGAERELTVGFGSFGSVVAAFFGFLVAVAMLGAFGAATARLLGGRPTIISTYLYDAFAMATTAWVAAVLAVFAVAWKLRQQQVEPRDMAEVSDLEAEITRGFQEDHRSFFVGQLRKRKWLGAIQKARNIRMFVRTVEPIFGWMVMVGMSLAITLLAWQQVFPDSLRSSVEWVPEPIRVASGWFVAVAIPVGIIWAIRRAYGSGETRKMVGTLWDVVTFWPRWFHPLAPPSYSGRAVPELRTRIHALVSSGAEDGASASVVVTAHSQGSVLALAALDGFGGQSWIGQVALVTHGSPITRLYMRLFPAHMIGPIGRVFQVLDEKRWVNMYRLTDPIGGAISGEDDSGEPLIASEPDGATALVNPSPDPDLDLFSETVTLEGGTRGRQYPKKGDPYPPPLVHSGYRRSENFQSALRSMLGLT